MKLNANTRRAWLLWASISGSSQPNSRAMPCGKIHTSKQVMTMAVVMKRKARLMTVRTPSLSPFPTWMAPSDCSV